MLINFLYKIIFNFVVSKIFNLLKKIDEFALNFLKFQKHLLLVVKSNPPKKSMFAKIIMIYNQYGVMCFYYIFDKYM
jgi:hypothetical protein